MGEAGRESGSGPGVIQALGQAVVMVTASPFLPAGNSAGPLRGKYAEGPGVPEGLEFLQIIEIHREGMATSTESTAFSQACCGAVGLESLVGLRGREVATEPAKRPLGKSGRLSGQKGFAAVLAFWAKHELKWITECFKTKKQNTRVCACAHAHTRQQREAFGNLRGGM